ncbi:MAG: class I SAM-dependent methyltransferase, partial [Deltaproteobacteria bacterium]|nr:class I SAM-dependent methyltransferase [Deltaproteobacteria bacterium]
MVKRAKKKFEDHQNVNFIPGSVEILPFDDIFFEHVICFVAFPHFDSKKKALKEMHRVLKAGGNLFIAHALSSAQIKAHHRASSPVANDF